MYAKYIAMKITKIELTDSELNALKCGFHNGESHVFRMRCQAIILKSRGLASAKVGEQTEMIAQTVNGWLKRYKAEGIKGLDTRPGQGRKPIMDSSDEEIVRKVVEEDRQRVDNARQEWQKATGKVASEWTFRRFLGVLAQDIGG